jgi:hypothetical protein
MNLEIKKENVRNDSTSCNFCQRGKLGEYKTSLIYPYDEVLTFKRSNASGLRASICKECLDELCKAGSKMLNSEQSVQESDTTDDAQGTSAG